MTPEQFAAGIKTVAFDPAVRGTIKRLEEGPPGRGPHPRGTALSSWYNALSDGDRQMVIECVRDAAHAAVFNVLCVLDGVVIGFPQHAQLRLTATDERENPTTLASGDSPVELHDEFNGVVHPPTEPWPDLDSE